MKDEGNNIFSVFDELLQRSDKEIALNQFSKVIWMTGLSGSGKTSIAIGLERKLHTNGYLTQILDGDNIRTGINKNLGFSDEDRTENIRRIAEVSKLFLNCGVITINCFVSPTIKIRKQAQQIIGENDFIEVFINTPLDVCEQRDPKGLYKKARNGEIKDFTGVSALFEEPTSPSIEIKTEKKSIEDCVNALYSEILILIKR
ncbi:MAG: adenylyl-sulfate kinase [Flavobacteriales bacterium]|nr:adenylyl-sulfate kinase [Flavobacteriales bacterium]MBT6745457.1 adenylyl-sulfate kinase [Flavobacteriales bacterium]